MPCGYRFAAAVVIALVFAASPCPASADPVRVYRVEDLGFLGGSNYLVGVAINAHGDVAGWTTGADGVLRAFRWTAAGALEDLGTNGGQAAMASAINDAGDVVGQYWAEDGGELPFIARRGGVMTDLSTMYPEILEIDSINNDGQLAGLTRSGHAFKTLPGGALVEFGTHFSFAASLNGAGEVAGVGWHDETRSLPQTAFRYSDATALVDLGTIRGGGSGAYAINSRGVIVGWAGGTQAIPARAFRAKPGLPMEDLGVLAGGFLGGTAVAYAVNDAGDTVGAADGPLGWSPFLYTDARGMIDLRDRMPIADQWVFVVDAATAINQAGQIVAGYNSPSQDRYGTVRLTPVPFDGPVAAPTADPSVLGPPNHRMVAVTVAPHATDAYDAAPICRIARVVNSEGPRSGLDRDVAITGPLSVNLRATRQGSGPGRSYTITLGCSDVLGAASMADVVVVAPHDHGEDDENHDPE